MNQLSRNKSEYLLHHIIFGIAASIKGTMQLREKGMIDEKNYHFLLEQNSKRIIERVEKFKQTLSLCLAALFIALQVTSHDLDLRRTSRLRLRRIEEEQTSNFLA